SDSLRFPQDKPHHNPANRYNRRDSAFRTTPPGSRPAGGEDGWDLSLKHFKERSPDWPISKIDWARERAGLLAVESSYPAFRFAAMLLSPWTVRGLASLERCGALPRRSLRRCSLVSSRCLVNHSGKFFMTLQVDKVYVVHVRSALDRDLLIRHQMAKHGIAF